MFTDVTYYRGDINIPNSVLVNASFENDYINVYEEEYLRLVLGHELYDLFIAGIAQETPDSKWTELRNGVVYDAEVNGTPIKMKWEGLINASKKSPLSYYVFIQYLKNNYNQLLQTGVGSGKKENANDVNVQEKLIIAYKGCEKLTGKYNGYLSNDTPPMLFQNDIDKNLIDVSGNLLSFLYYHKQNYPSWVFTFPDVYGVNTFDL